MSLRRTLRRPARALGLALLGLALAGCWNPFSPRLAPSRGISTPPPVPNTPQNTLRLLEWCYNNRAIAEYRELFTDDYRFAFSAVDSAGNPYRDRPWTREDELISASRLFVEGSAEQPAASSIVLTLDRNFYVFPDTRPGKHGKWHKNIRTQVVLNIRTGDGNQIDVSGAANFFLVRGDSALIPPELVGRGFRPDSNRWYIERWEDETAQAGTPATLAPPARARVAGANLATPVRSSWGAVKIAFRRP